MDEKHIYLQWIQNLLIDGYKSFSVSPNINRQISSQVHSLISEKIDLIFGKIPQNFKDSTLFRIAICMINQRFPIEFNTLDRILEYLSKEMPISNFSRKLYEKNKMPEIDKLGALVVEYYIRMKFDPNWKKSLKNYYSLLDIESALLKWMNSVMHDNLVPPGLSFTELVGSGQFCIAYFAKHRKSIIMLKRCKFGKKLTTIDKINNWKELDVALNTYHVKKPIMNEIENRTCLLCFAIDFYAAVLAKEDENVDSIQEPTFLMMKNDFENSESNSQDDLENTAKNIVKVENIVSDSDKSLSIQNNFKDNLLILPNSKKQQFNTDSFNISPVEHKTMHSSQNDPKIGNLLDNSTNNVQNQVMFLKIPNRKKPITKSQQNTENTQQNSKNIDQNQENNETNSNQINQQENLININQNSSESDKIPVRKQVEIETITNKENISTKNGEGSKTKLFIDFNQSIQNVETNEVATNTEEIEKMPTTKTEKNPKKKNEKQTLKDFIKEQNSSKQDVERVPLSLVYDNHQDQKVNLKKLAKQKFEKSQQKSNFEITQQANIFDKSQQTTNFTKPTLSTTDFETSQQSTNFVKSQQFNDFDDSQQIKNDEKSQQKTNYHISQSSKMFESTQQANDIDSSQQAINMENSLKSSKYSKLQAKNIFEKSQPTNIFDISPNTKQKQVQNAGQNFTSSIVVATPVKKKNVSFVPKDFLEEDSFENFVSQIVEKIKTRQNDLKQPIATTPADVNEVPNYYKPRVFFESSSDSEEDSDDPLFRLDSLVKQPENAPIYQKIAKENEKQNIHRLSSSSHLISKSSKKKKEFDKYTNLGINIYQDKPKSPTKDTKSPNLQEKSNSNPNKSNIDTNSSVNKNVKPISDDLIKSKVDSEINQNSIPKNQKISDEFSDISAKADAKPDSKENSSFNMQKIPDALSSISFSSISAQKLTKSKSMEQNSQNTPPNVEKSKSTDQIRESSSKPAQISNSEDSSEISFDEYPTRIINKVSDSDSESNNDTLQLSLSMPLTSTQEIEKNKMMKQSSSENSKHFDSSLHTPMLSPIAKKDNAFDNQQNSSFNEEEILKNKSWSEDKSGENLITFEFQALYPNQDSIAPLIPEDSPSQIKKTSFEKPEDENYFIKVPRNITKMENSSKSENKQNNDNGNDKKQLNNNKAENQQRNNEIKRVNDNRNVNNKQNNDGNQEKKQNVDRKRANNDQNGNKQNIDKKLVNDAQNANKQDEKKQKSGIPVKKKEVANENNGTDGILAELDKIAADDYKHPPHIEKRQVTKPVEKENVDNNEELKVTNFQSKLENKQPFIQVRQRPTITETKEEKPKEDLMVRGIQIPSTTAINKTQNEKEKENQNSSSEKPVKESPSFLEIKRKQDNPITITPPPLWSDDRVSTLSSSSKLEENRPPPIFSSFKSQNNDDDDVIIQSISSSSSAEVALTPTGVTQNKIKIEPLRASVDPKMVKRVSFLPEFCHPMTRTQWLEDLKSQKKLRRLAQAAAPKHFKTPKKVEIPVTSDGKKSLLPQAKGPGERMKTKKKHSREDDDILNSTQTLTLSDVGLL